jgi:DHA2 family multidrug resistance protein
VHFGHLAEMVTANSPIAHFIPAIQAFFVSQGSDLFSAHQAALQLIARFVQREAFVLAIQDAFRLTIVIIAVALIATFFVRGTRRQRNVPQQNGPQEKQSPVPAEAKATGEPDEAEHFVAVEI